MKRLLSPIIFAGVALASGVASANHDAYWSNNGLLLEVSADPRDGRDIVQVDPTSADSLELVALNDVVNLRELTLHMSDGRTISQHVGPVQPGAPVEVALPGSCGAITSVELGYGNPARRRSDRTDARLQIIPHRTYREPVTVVPQPTPAPAYPSSIGGYPSYRAPVYAVRPQVALRPRARNTWTIRGSFRF
jgi:hypothetical protein